MAELKCLFMSKNVLHGLEGIQRLKALVTLDVSHNDLYSLAPLSKLTTLQSLNAGHNKLSGAEGIAPLQGCTQLKTLDLEKNRIESREALGAIMAMPLSLLRLVGNPVVSATKWVSHFPSFHTPNTVWEQNTLPGNISTMSFPVSMY